MSFKSQAQIAKFKELVTSGKITQQIFDKHIKETSEPHKLPKRVPSSK